MKFTTASEHRDFFRKHQLIEFEDLLSPDQVQQLSKGINDALAQKLGIKPEKMKEVPSQKLFTAGRDLWRADPALKKIILQSSLAEIASELVDIKPVRIGYDQLFSISSSSMPLNKDEKYHQLLQATRSLNEISSLQGLIVGLMICLSSTQEPKQTLSLFSSKIGNGVFFHPDLAIDFSPLLEGGDNSYLLITYCRNTTIYCLQNEDPHTHDFKHLGYTYGDRLAHRLHPIIFR